MRAHIMIVAIAVLAMIVAHMASTEDRVIGDPDCTVDCSGQADTDNGIGSSLTVTSHNDADGDNN
jgi:hypothetical protein